MLLRRRCDQAGVSINMLTAHSLLTELAGQMRSDVFVKDSIKEISIKPYPERD